MAMDTGTPSSMERYLAMARHGGSIFAPIRAPVDYVGHPN